MTTTARLLAGLTNFQYQQIWSTASNAAYRSARNAPPGQAHALYEELLGVGMQWVKDNAEAVEVLYFNNPRKVAQSLWSVLVKVMLDHRRAMTQPVTA